MTYIINVHLLHLHCCTSHVINFETHTFGTFSSVIFDSWIFSNDYILSVGNLSLAGQGDFSAVLWNGESWEVIQMNYNRDLLLTNLRAVWAFSQEDIWFAGGSIFHWDGNNDYLTTIEWIIDFQNYPNEGVYNIWASSPENIYFVGPGGCIIHYDGSDFIRMESGTDIWLKDVWGNVDPDTGEETVWASGWTDMAESVLLVYRGEEWGPVYDVQSLYWEYLYDHVSGSIKSIWSTDNYLYVLSTNGLYQCSHDTQGEGMLILEGTLFVNYWHKVRGTDDNDIFVVGSNQEVMHFNGAIWEQIDYSPGNYLFNIQVSENVIIGGGWQPGEGVIDRALLWHGGRGE